MNKIRIAIIVLAITLMFGCTSSNEYSEYTKEPVTSGVINTGDESVEIDYEDLKNAYDYGWNDAVEEVFIDHDVLYFDDNEYACEDYLYPSGEPMSDSIESAHDEGREAAISEIFADTEVLCYGEERYFRDDY